MIYKRIKSLIFIYRIESCISLAISSLIFIGMWILANQQVKEYERTLENQLQKFEITSRIFIEEIDSITQDRKAIVKKLDEIRNALTWYFKISFGEEQSVGQIKPPIVVDASGFNIENKKKVEAATFDNGIQVYQSQIIYSKPFIFNQENFYLVLAMGIKKDIAISINQISSGGGEYRNKICGSYNIFSLIRRYGVVLLISFFLLFFISQKILKKIGISNQKHAFFLYRRRFKLFLLLQSEIYGLKKKFFTLLNTNKLLTSRLSESAKTYVAMSDKTIHLIRQLHQPIEKPTIKSNDGIIIYDIFRQQEKCFAKIVDEVLILLNDPVQDKKSITHCFESRGNGVFLGDHDFIFFSLYLIFKDIMRVDSFSDIVVVIQSYISKDYQLVLEIQGFSEEPSFMPLNDLEFIVVSFNKNKKLLKIIFEGVFVPEEPKKQNKKYSNDRGDNVVSFIKP